MPHGMLTIAETGHYTPTAAQVDSLETNCHQYHATMASLRFTQHLQDLPCLR
jgi:hypothetical protein